MHYVTLPGYDAATDTFSTATHVATVYPLTAVPRAIRSLNALAARAPSLVDSQRYAAAAAYLRKAIRAIPPKYPL